MNDSANRTRISQAAQRFDSLTMIRWRSPDISIASPDDSIAVAGNDSIKMTELWFYRWGKIKMSN